ncbi:HD domain-containing phosphohydrolase [Thermodesulforhabdus norvegica]|uniref:Response regulator c-di-GMP phosphodiesterase, RpfG family, contains REC and HD-GYP domains n=1 Tax=Thermodesulforhabdus norvegica TaxID=39841 RepID=A0A1I4SWC4_9BACT|nr:HD domain-containing phosphohydrolase [Thermodesulforhabdus norvegica]SFM68838.1 Response regulator c-di-GMP phosphodiesterase, RpfG family, contains REC and HD-GYP domains [Thermodesulforhabdus norvegica]
MGQSEKILFVDDEPNLLMAVKRSLHNRFSVDTAESGKEGLEKIKKQGPYAVVVADLRMPIMDGIQFLTRVREISPETVRMMLTGYADVTTAIEAINSGNVFRFLTKPCAVDVLVKNLEAGLQQYRLIRAEKELLEKTLKGCIALLSEVLSLTNPEAFGRASRIARYAVWIAREVGYGELWKVETAAMLSQLGCLLVPEETILKVYRGEELVGEEKQLMEMHPSVAAHLIRHIPRLEDIARIVAYQEKHYDGSGIPIDTVKGEEIPIESRILKLAIDLEKLVSAGHPITESYQIMRSCSGVYDPALMPGLARIVNIQANYKKKSLYLKELRGGMIVAGSVYSSDGRLLIREGHEITPVILQRLRNFAATVGVNEPIEVYVPQQSSDRSPN